MSARGSARLSSNCAPAGFRRPSRARWETRDGARRVIAWSGTAACRRDATQVEYVILTGIDMTEAKRLERTILEISGREQRRIGQDLHDGLGQHLTGVAFMSKVLEQKLREKEFAGGRRGRQNRRAGEPGDRQDARAVARSAAGAVGRAGLMTALETAGIAGGKFVSGVVPLRVRRPAPIRESDIATHLYHIAQEAVNNALKHGQPRHIAIRLAGGGEPFLSVDDDGVGLREPLRRPGGQGMGLLIMSYRAKMIGGALEVRPGPAGGTEVLLHVSGEQSGAGGELMTPQSRVVSAVRKATVLLVDDHPIVRQGLTQLINQEADLAVCAQAEDGAAPCMPSRSTGRIS